nr:immunoglobulin light chain junction region [Macaca mulatta]MOW67447.1 immunoglobulin light chain junction region [Macaca mulatta]MOW70234.1 immunoglobulin light chain junction region [Macaca mulatta]MOW72388.1 immunoglobulin light chain junction region [Macaca mulatta]
DYYCQVYDSSVVLF